MCAHGATVSETELLENTGVCVIDATCPFVSKIHEIVKERSDKGDVILIGGNGMHPEVAGIKSRAACSRVFSDSAELESLAENEPELLAKSTTFVWQTTFNLQEFDKCNKIIKKDLKIQKFMIQYVMRQNCAKNRQLSLPRYLMQCLLSEEKTAQIQTSCMMSQSVSAKILFLWKTLKKYQ